MAVQRELQILLIENIISEIQAYKDGEFNIE